jgi:hypothetical protein
MFAIGHAATALVIKRAYPSVPMTPLLISVQAMEFAWVALNHLGIERPPRSPLSEASPTFIWSTCPGRIRWQPRSSRRSRCGW